ncbi:hypothetical protein [Acinetobacter nectaris]|uniref:hypothetical protein n=1 Tax=Acinetobacter nectaris TaxID=1219382 RepID=UPI001F197C7A|nr:hypothetical protein [Acinetobacter nectaris]MCF9034409.1 hypothetical protein [Acinetobacter nectaris]
MKANELDSRLISMSLSELQQEHAELLAFNEKLDRERNQYRDQASKYLKKVEMIASLFVVPGDDHELTLKAIKTIVNTVGEQ